MKLELIQIKQNGAKENSQKEEKSRFDLQEVSETPRCCPSKDLITFSRHLNKMPIFFYLHGICYIKIYDNKRVNTQVKSDPKL